MSENPTHPADQDSAYLTRRAKKNYRARIVTFVLLTLFFGMLIALASIPIREQIRINSLNRLAQLPFPDVSVNGLSNLLFEDNPFSTRISTQWLTTNKYLDDQNMYAGYVRVQAADFLWEPSRKYPPTEILIYVSAQHPARLPLRDQSNLSLTLIAHETITIPNDLMGKNLVNVSPQAQSDTTYFEIPTKTFINAINHGSITLKLADHKINFTDNQFLALKDFAATLKPGFEPPTSLP